MSDLAICHSLRRDAGIASDERFLVLISKARGRPLDECIRAEVARRGYLCLEIWTGLVCNLDSAASEKKRRESVWS
jgi:hypothetical protein